MAWRMSACSFMTKGPEKVLKSKWNAPSSFAIWNHINICSNFLIGNFLLWNRVGNLLFLQKLTIFKLSWIHNIFQGSVFQWLFYFTVLICHVFDKVHMLLLWKLWTSILLQDYFQSYQTLKQQHQLFYYHVCMICLCYFPFFHTHISDQLKHTHHFGHSKIKCLKEFEAIKIIRNLL